mmetsp:Transcript_77205/g.136238  ORF Transcript_77205/g.136238 Transcript_77205/m.136238 type:complete len:224 (+) Transcript_77205:84-755(+)
MGCTSGKASVGKVGKVPNEGNTLLQNPSPAIKETQVVDQSTSEPATAANATEERPKVTEEAVAHEEETQEPSTESRMEAATTEDKVTKINSNVLLVNYVPTEEEDVSSLPSGSRSSKRKATPWHKAGAPAVVDFEIDEEEEEEEAEEERKEPLQRKAVRKATPWTKGAQVLDMDDDEDDEEPEKAAQEITKGETAQAAPTSWFAYCTRPCRIQDTEQELVLEQ